MQIDVKRGETRIVQDIPKEDYILCKECEKYFGILEAICSLPLKRLYDFRHQKQFIHFRNPDLAYKELKILNNKAYNLFIYSIVWRSSISAHPGFETFSLPKESEETLRKFILRFKASTQTIFNQNIKKMDDLPGFGHVLIGPERRTYPPGSDLSVDSSEPTFHEIHLVDFVLVFTIPPKELINNLLALNNNTLLRNPRVGIIDTSAWHKYHKELQGKIL